MQSGTLGAELQHRAHDHGERSAAPLGQPVGELHGPVERSRIGVVAVVDDGEPAQLEQRAPPARDAGIRECRHCSRRVGADLASHGERQQRVLDLVKPDDGQGDGVASPGEPRMPAVVEHGRVGPELRAWPRPRDHGPRPAPCCDRELWRIGPDHRHPHVVDERELLPHHAGERAKPREVGIADVRDHGDRGLDHGSEPRDLAGNTCPGLYHERVRVIGSAEQRQRHAHQVVQVAAGRVHAVRRGEHCPDQLLRARLPARSGHRHDRATRR